MPNIKQVTLIVLPVDANHTTLSSRLLVVPNAVTEVQLTRWCNFTISSALEPVLGQLDVVLPEATTAGENQYLSVQDGHVHERDVIEVVDVVSMTAAEVLQHYPGLAHDSRLA